jgi:hypothetical protein
MRLREIPMWMVFPLNLKKGWRAKDLEVQELSKSNFDGRFLSDRKSFQPQ